MSPFGAARDGARRVERGLDRRLVVAVVAVLARSGDRRDDAGRLVDAADAIVVRVGDDQIAVGRDRHAVGRVELRVGGEPVVARKAGAEIVVAGDGRDDPVLRRRCAE